MFQNLNVYSISQVFGWLKITPSAAWISHQMPARLALPPYTLRYLFLSCSTRHQPEHTTSPQTADRAKYNCAQLFPGRGSTFGMKPESEWADISEQTLPSAAGNSWSSFNVIAMVRGSFHQEQTPGWCVISQRNCAGNSLHCKKRWEPLSFLLSKSI